MKRLFLLMTLCLMATVAPVYAVTGIVTNTTSDLVTKGPWVDVRAFTNLSTAKASPQTAGKEIWITNAQSVKNLTIPADRGLRFIQGGTVSVASGKLLTISGQFVAGSQQVFTGAGSVGFAAGSLKEVLPEWWGAKGDGITDSAVAIDSASKSISVSGGVVRLAPGQYLLGTLSSDANAHNSYIVLRDNVSIVGAGIDVTSLKVKSGENARFSGSNAPNIMSTQQTSLLKNVHISGLTFDWNGANNLLTSGMTARNNASIITINGAENLVIEHVKFKETPGNQCIFIKNTLYTTNPGSAVIVRENIFIDSGSGLAGNYNNDHSSVYLQIDNSSIVNNQFTSSTPINGTAFELHGSNTSAYDNKINYYGNMTYIATDDAVINNINVHDNEGTNLDIFFSVTAQTYAVNDVRVHNNIFKQRATPSAGVTFVVNGNTIVGCNNMEIIDNTFVGRNVTDQRLMQHYKIANFKFVGNNVTGFSDSYGIQLSNLDVGSGQLFDSMLIANNVFDGTYTAVTMSSATLVAKNLMISGNTFTGAGGAALSIGTAAGSTGYIGQNIYTGHSATVVGTASDGSKGIQVDSLSRTIYGVTAAPSSGTWAVGDRAVRTPAVGQPKAWSCTVGGTPGTWTSEGTL